MEFEKANQGQNGSFFFLPTKMLSGWNKTGEMTIRRCLCSATNEIWVIGESNLPSVAQTFLFCLGIGDNNFYEYYSGTVTKLKSPGRQNLDVINLRNGPF